MCRDGGIVSIQENLQIILLNFSHPCGFCHKGAYFLLTN